MCGNKHQGWSYFWLDWNAWKPIDSSPPCILYLIFISIQHNQVLLCIRLCGERERDVYMSSNENRYIWQPSNLSYPSKWCILKEPEHYWDSLLSAQCFFLMKHVSRVYKSTSFVYNTLICRIYIHINTEKKQGSDPSKNVRLFASGVVVK